MKLGSEFPFKKLFNWPEGAEETNHSAFFQKVQVSPSTLVSDVSCSPAPEAATNEKTHSTSSFSGFLVSLPSSTLSYVSLSRIQQRSVAIERKLEMNVELN